MIGLRRVADWLVRPEERSRARERLADAGVDLLVGLAVLVVALVVVAVAAVALGTFVLGAGGVLGIVGGWVGMFALVLLVPIAVMKVATALYGRFRR